MNYINVVVDNKSKQTDIFYTYKTCEDVKIGSRVKVPFNVKNSLKDAYVVEFNVDVDYDKSKIKSVKEVGDISLNEEMIKTSIWMKQRYGIKFIDGIKCFVPKGKSAMEGRHKDALRDYKCEKQIIEALTKEQDNAIFEINESISNNLGKIFLLHGVTNSGKTEVYMNAVEKALELGKTAIVLEPEIALTRQVVERFAGRFGKENIALLHSKLTQRERYDQWEKLRNGTAKIAIGARLGVFAPLENIGVIIMDEEHESTYKSDMSPKYDTVDVALKRLRHYNGTLILGSATPSVVSYERVDEGIYQLLELKERYNKIPLPQVSLVDMRMELKKGNRSIFSKQLKTSMNDALKTNEQVILFLNRRGYSNYISCRGCGETIKCPECKISLTFHKKENALICHYCGKTMPIPTKCPSCSSKYLKPFGIGTEQVHEQVQKEFPNIVVARLDLDTAKNTKEINTILTNFSKGKTQILVGTQLVAKGLDFNNVGLVGVLMADTALNVPDYRSSERAFQLITQVSGRAGRGDKQGKVVVQTYSPENFAIKAGAKQDYKEFYNQEIKYRRLFGYPPFSDMVVVNFTSSDENRAYAMALDFLEYIKGTDSEAFDKRTFAPKVSFSFKGNNGFRYYVLIKCLKKDRNKCLYLIDRYSDSLDNKDCSINIDVNPYSTI